jgi:hypothetical protein
VNFDRFVELPAPDGVLGDEKLRLCLSCADPKLRYWRPIEN